MTGSNVEISSQIIELDQPSQNGKSVSMSQELWEVVDITNRRYNVDLNDYEFFTTWKDCSRKTWEPRSCFSESDGSVTDILTEFEKKHPIRPMKKIKKEDKNTQ